MDTLEKAIHNLSEGQAKIAVRLWDQDIATRPENVKHHAAKRVHTTR